MDGYTPFPVYDMQQGRVTEKKPWLLPQDAYQNMLNAYVDKGALKKRKGYTLLARLAHRVEGESVGTGDAMKTTFVAVIKLVPLRDVVGVTDGVEAFTDNGDGTSVTPIKKSIPKAEMLICRALKRKGLA